MCNFNRYLDSTRLASSAALPFLRTVIKNNERERALCKDSAWCRHTSEQNVVEMDKILTILIEQRYASFYGYIFKWYTILALILQ